MLYLFFPLLLLYSTGVFACALSIQQALILGFTHHPELQISEQDLILSKQAILLEKDAFRPQATLQSSGKTQENRQNLEMQERFQWHTAYGTDVAISMTQQTGDQWHHRHDHADLGLRVSIKQPLLKGWGKLYNQYGLMVVTLEQLAALHQHQMIQQSLLQNMLSSYRGVQLKTLNLKQQKNLLDGTERLEETILQKIRLGKMPEMEKSHIKLQVQKERVAYKQIEDDLSLAWLKLWDALGLPPDPTYHHIVLPHEHALQLDEKATSIEKALASDIKLKVLMLRYAQVEQSLEKAKQETWWDLDLHLASTWGSTWHRPFTYPKHHQHDKLAELRLTAPLSNRKAKIKAENQRIALKKMDLNIAEQRRKIKIKVEALWQDVHNLNQQKESAKAWLALAEESLALSQKKLELGRASMVELMHYTDQLRAAEIQYAKLTISTLNAKTALDFATGDLLAEWGDLIAASTSIST